MNVRWILFAVLTALGGFVAVVANADSKIELTTEVAHTRTQRFMGLSFRENLGENEGMLFVYPDEQMLTFTMRNTLIPLTIAYLSKDLVINEFHEMPVGPNQLFPGKKPAQFALEVNQGWFEKNDIAVGDRVTVR